MPSNRSSFDDAGCPSSKPSGFTNDTAGSVLLSTAAKKSVASLICAVRCAASPMIAVAYDSKLQMLQYALPICTSGSGLPGFFCFFPRRVVRPAVIRPRYSFFIQRLTDRAYIGRRNGAPASDPRGVHRAIRKKSRRVIVHHVEASRLALGIGTVRKRRQVIVDRLYPRLRQIAALREVAVKQKVHGIN